MEMFRIIREVNEAGVAILLVEQNVAMALALARRAYVLEEGRIVAEGEPRELLSPAPTSRRPILDIETRKPTCHTK